jgi:hypothetical protein
MKAIPFMPGRFTLLWQDKRCSLSERIHEILSLLGEKEVFDGDGEENLAA